MEFRRAPLDPTAISRLLVARGRLAHVIASTAVVGLTAAYVGPLMRTGWVPFDEGTLGQSAHRILIGQLPHRDFDEVYTGGLSFMHAIAFRVLGENLLSLRVMLFAAILLVMPACYYIASRFASPVVAAGLSLAVLLSSFPSYPAAMPSWYNLILALYGCAALLRYVEVRQKRWIFAAGLSGGLSIVVKIVGLYFVAAAALFLVFHAYSSRTGRERNDVARHRLAALVVLFAVGALAIGPFLILRHSFRPAEVFELAIPIVATCITVACEVWRSPGRCYAGSSVTILASIGPFVLGVLIPLACFAIPYARDGALLSLYRGLIILPQSRITWAAEPAPPVAGLLLGVPALYLIMSARFSARQLRWYDALLIIAVEGALVAWSALSLTVSAAVWNAIRMTGPLVVVAATIVLTFPQITRGTSEPRRQQLFLFAAAAAWCALVQFPATTYQYFLYVLPLFIFAATALAVVRATVSGGVALSSLFAFLVLSLFLRPVLIAGGGSHVALKRGERTASLDVARGGLVIRQQERDDYVRLIETIHMHSRSPFIYVSPDAPEVYFLADRENPTRTLFDFFDDQTNRAERVLSAIREHGVDLVVINHAPRFSGHMPQALYDSLSAQFGEKAEVAQFEVRWRS
jgi:hypothetical protein